MNSNRLVINPEKTHLMVLGSRRMRPETMKVSVQVRNLRINPTDTEKYMVDSYTTHFSGTYT